MKHISILVLCLLLCHIGRAQTGRAFMTSPDGGMYAYKKINHTVYDTTDYNPQNEAFRLFRTNRIIS